jgi:hypothetical protein
VVYTLVRDVLKEIDLLFKDSDFIHLGGDEVGSACWDKVPAIKTFMAAHNISNYGELQMYWRKEMRQAFDDTRKVGFWKNTGDNVTTGPDDILHYWGAQSATADCTSFMMQLLKQVKAKWYYLLRTSSILIADKASSLVTHLATLRLGGKFTRILQYIRRELIMTEFLVQKQYYGEK